MLRQMMLTALTAACLVAPAAGSAQPYYAQGYARDYDGPRGDYNRGGRRFGGYPEFRGLEGHIRREIVEGVREDLIERDDARDLMAQLRDIQRDEAREFRVHRWDLPPDDRYRLRARLNDLDRLVDQIRAEP